MCILLKTISTIFCKKLQKLFNFYVKRSDPDPKLFFQDPTWPKRFRIRLNPDPRHCYKDACLFFKEMEGNIPPVPENDIVKSER